MIRRHSHATPRKPAGLRWAAIVYVVVVLLGVAAAGAQAYWSQSGTVVTNVTTGKWGPQKITGLSCSGEKHRLLSATTVDLLVGYKTSADTDKVEVTVSKGDTVVSVSVSRQNVKPSRPYTETLPTPLMLWAEEDFVLKITPFYQGTAGEPTVSKIKVKHYVATVKCAING